MRYLCVLLTICLRYGIVPESFTTGILIPLLKKPSCDPSIAKNYRPVVVSTTFTKLLEMFVLEEGGCHDFDDAQFGFVPGRGTNMAISLTHDVMSYCVKGGTPVFSCSLDAEGAFDAIPHPVFFQKIMDILPAACWIIICSWYMKLTVQLRWNGSLSKPIRVMKGTRQGGLSSPFIFNAFYQDMICELNKTIGGVCINDVSYNVSCYADDILLTSTTVTGLQTLIRPSV